MNTFEKIVHAIEKFRLPLCAGCLYRRRRRHFFTYNYATDKGAIWGDNGAEAVTADIQLHFFLPAADNFIKIKKEIRNALTEAGFTFPEITVLKEEDTRHIVFECEIEEEDNGIYWICKTNNRYIYGWKNLYKWISVEKQLIPALLRNLQKDLVWR